MFNIADQTVLTPPLRPSLGLELCELMEHTGEKYPSTGKFGPKIVRTGQQSVQHQ